MDVGRASRQVVASRTDEKSREGPMPPIPERQPIPGGPRSTPERPAAAALLAVSLVLAGCATPGGGPPPDRGLPEPPSRSDTVGFPAMGRAPRGPAPGELVTGELPPIPRVAGPIRLHVEYPDSLQLVTVPDSNFIFGTVGTGDARLAVNGEPVHVHPNGAFLAWLPLPPVDTAGRATYTLVATRTESGAEDTLRHPIRRPRPGYTPPPDGAWLDTASVTGPSGAWVLPDEVLEVEARAAPGALVQLQIRRAERPGSGCRQGTEPREPPDDGCVVRRSMRARPETPERYLARMRARRLLPPGTTDTLRLELTVTAEAAGDTVRHRWTRPLRVLDPVELPVAELHEVPDAPQGRNGLVVGRPLPDGPYEWRFPVGTRAVVSGRVGNRYRLRLAAHRKAWVDTAEARLLPAGARRPESRVGDVDVQPLGDRLRLELPVAVPLPLDVEEPGPRTLVLRLFGASSDTERLGFGPADPYLDGAAAFQEAEGVYRLELRFRRAVWGYRTGYEIEEDGSAVLVLEVRRPPVMDPDRPLRGIRVAVDPGHPWAGARGPTGLYEADANLAIARRLVGMLREAGADPVQLRTDTLPMGLYERTEAAEAADADVFVSIHNNALSDGLRPFGREGTSTYFYRRHAEELAGALQRGMLRAMGLRDLGVFRGNLAVARLSWMPAALTEGAFMMMPRHEAALRTEGFQEAYARGVLHGLEAFLGDRAREAAGGEPDRRRGAEAATAARRTEHDDAGDDAGRGAGGDGERERRR